MRLTTLTVVFVMLGGVPALADTATEWIERSHEAVFDSSQIVTCQTPDGQVDGVFDVAGTGQAVQAGQGASQRVYGADNVFATADASESIAVPTAEHDDLGAVYSSVETHSDRFDGRRTKAFNLVRDDVLRAIVVFDFATGALLTMSTYNGDGSDYCTVETTSFSQPVGLAEEALQVEPAMGLESIDADDAVAPSVVAGFVRLDTYRWRESGSASFYSDGLFSFTLVSAPTTFALSDSDASNIELDSGTYRRLFEPGRSTYVWESETGGMSLVGDLPLDLQESVLAELAPAERPGLLTRLWRSLFR
jgi:negative regulator of sigma E activity